MANKIITLDKLASYDALLKNYMGNKDSVVLSTAKCYTDDVSGGTDLADRITAVEEAIETINETDEYNELLSRVTTLESTIASMQEEMQGLLDNVTDIDGDENTKSTFSTTYSSDEAAILELAGVIANG